MLFVKNNIKISLRLSKEQLAKVDAFSETPDRLRPEAKVPCEKLNRKRMLFLLLLTVCVMRVVWYFWEQLTSTFVIELTLVNTCSVAKALWCGEEQWGLQRWKQNKMKLVRRRVLVVSCLTHSRAGGQLTTRCRRTDSDDAADADDAWHADVVRTTGVIYSYFQF